MKCDCANCPTHACYTRGVNCTGVPLEAVKEAYTEEELKLMQAAAYVEGTFYSNICRLQETAEFAKAMGYKKLGMSFCQEPNLVYHVYKVRRGKINHVKVFVNFDYGTLRTTDLFVTDRDYKLLDVKGTNIEILLDQTDMTEEAEKHAASASDVFKF